MERRQIMKRFFKISTLAFVALAAILTLSKCKVDEGGIYGAFPYMNVPFSDTLISKLEQTIYIPVETNRSITANVTDSTWVKATIDGKSIVLIVQPNDLESTRSTTIEVKTINSTVSATITLTQDASGEITIEGDLILTTPDEVENNTYTRATQSLIVGNVISNTAASASAAIKASQAPKTASLDGNITVTFDNKILEVAPSDISDRQSGILSENIHTIGSKSAAYINTKVSTFPYKLVYHNELETSFFVACELKRLPSSDSLKKLNLKEIHLGHNQLEDISSIKGLENLTKLNLSYNRISDIASLKENPNIEELVLDYNPISDIDPLTEMQNLKRLSLKGLPILGTQYEIISEKLPEGCITDTTDIKEEESPLARICEPQGKVYDASSITLTAKMEHKGDGEITESGYYWGTSRKLSEMSFITGIYNETDSTITASLQDINTTDQIYFFRACAQNSAGKSYSKIGRYGEKVTDGDYFIYNENDFKALYDQTITKINGSVYIGNMVNEPGDGTISTTREPRLHFDHSTINSLDYLRNVDYIDGGLYLINTDVKEISIISDIEHISTLHLEGNKIENIPDLTNIMGLRTLNIARNKISDLTPLFNLTELDTLILGNSQYPYTETNNIGVLTGLETLTNLKYLDLSGLPLHQWQVTELRKNMPGCEIFFTPGNRASFLPIVTSETADISDEKIIIRGALRYKGEGEIIEYGFYWGKDKNNLSRVTAGTDNIESGTIFSYEISVSDDDVYYYQPYAVNTYGETKSEDFREFSLSFTNLSERGTSNSYIVSNAGRYTFNGGVIGNGSFGIIDTANFHTSNVEIYPTSAELLWESKEGMITDVNFIHENSEIRFVTDGTEGNAVIAAKDANGTILWSWHIWITDKPEEHNYINYNKQSFRVLDRNLGATRADRGAGNEWEESRGLAYQWGRKDPFEWYKCESVDRTLTIQESIENPTLVPENHYTWTPEQNYELWNDQIKTIYDPCPVGYRVAVQGVWSGFSKTGKSVNYLEDMNVWGEYYHGHNFIYDGTNTAWYPEGTSYNGYYPESGILWSSTKLGNAQLMVMSFGLDWLDIQNGTPATSQTHNIRCIYDQEYVDITLPTVTIDRISDVGYDSATAFATLHGQGSSDVTSMGFVWSTSHYPTLETGNNVELIPVIGEYSAPVTSLTGFVTYYIRAYATNAYGTAYSDELSFTTEFNGIIQDLSASGTSNCYIVPPVADHYSINASVIGNGSDGIIYDSNFHTEDVNINPASVKVLWAQGYDNYYSTSPVEDMISFIELNKENNSIHFVPTGKEGNVLIAAIDENDVILWSWHLWITDQPEEELYINHEGRMYYVLDRNVGATRADRGTDEQWREAVGMHYQWGRKDPFTNGYQTANSQLTMSRSIQHPTRMPVTSQWMETAIPQAWDDTTKTIYDPCPAGYKIIPLDAWTGFSTKGMDRWSGNVNYDYYNVRGNYNNGWDFVTNGDNTTYYPATGFGYHEIYAPPTTGYYWSATGDGYNGYGLHFYYEDGFNTSLTIFSEGSGYVRSVRCVADSDYTDPSSPEISNVSIEGKTSTEVTVKSALTHTGDNYRVQNVGFVYGTSPEIDIDNGEVIYSDEYPFTSVISGLEPFTEYYVKSFVITDKETKYSSAKRFTTLFDGNCTDLSSEGTANCYIISKSDTYKIKALRGNTQEYITGIDEVDILWESFGTLWQDYWTMKAI